MAQFYLGDVNLLARVQRILREEIERAEAVIDGCPSLEVMARLRRRDRLLREEREIGNLRERVKAAQANG